VEIRREEGSKEFASKCGRTLNTMACQSTNLVVCCLLDNPPEKKIKV